MQSSRAKSSAPLRMHLLALIGFLALVGAMAMLINTSSLRAGFATSGSIGLPDTSSSDSALGLAHVTTGRNASVNYDPSVIQHASIAGPDQTRLVPKEWIHQNNSFFSDVSTYWGGKWAHIREGYDKSKYINLDDWTHITIGAQATTIYPGENHIKVGPDATGYDPTAGGRFTHVSMGLSPTTYVVPWQHVEAGEFASAFAVDGIGSTAHITTGSNTTMFVLPSRHQTSGSNKTSMVQSGSTPESRPAPSPPMQ